MDKNLQIPQSKQFRAFYLFYIILAAQMAVDSLGTPRVIFEKAGHDAWISIIIAYLFILILLFIMLYILRQYENADILGIQADLFGTFIAKALGLIYVVFFMSQILATLLIYIEVVKIFIFPEISSFILGLMLLTLIIYSVLGGLRIIIGISFLFIIFSCWLIFLLYEPIRQMDLHNFLPIFDKGLFDVLKGAYATAFTFTGFEVLFFLYPFILDKKNAGKSVYLGFTMTTILILVVTVVSIGFLSPAQLERRIWSVLNLYKIQTSPIIEGLDYVVIAEWMMITVPRVILLMWCIIFILKRLYNVSMKVTLYTASAILLVIVSFLSEHFAIQAVIESSRILSYWLVYVYPVILLPLVMIKKKFRKKKEGSQNASS